MTGETVAGLLAVAMVGVACFHAGRLTLAVLWRRPTEVDVDVVHTVMGVAMAGMLTGWLNGGWNDAWMVVFAMSAAWFGRGLLRRPSDPRAAGLAIAHHLPHFVASAVMLYMLWAMRWTSVMGRQAGSMAAMGSIGHIAGSSPILPFVLAALVVGNAAVAAWTALSPSLGTMAVVGEGAGTGTGAASRTSMPTAAAATTVAACGTAPAARPRQAPVLGYRGAPACLVVMSVAMAYMVFVIRP